MRKKVLTISIFALTIFGCSNKTDETYSSEPIENIYNIELNDNKKWKVDEGMMIHIKAIDSEIRNTNNESYPDLKGLSRKLNNHIELLTSNCTMTGKAHDELHKWLLPFIDLVEELDQSKSKEEQKIIFQKIKKSMNEFNAFFE